MKKKLKIEFISLMLLLICIGLSGCNIRKYSPNAVVYKYDSNNMIGLSSIVLENNNIEITLKKDKIKHVPITIFYYKNSNKYNGPRCEINDKWYTLDAYNCREENGKIIINIKLENSLMADSFTIGNLDIINFEEPYIEYKMPGGEVIEYYKQKYNKSTKKWGKEEFEQAFFPLERID